MNKFDQLYKTLVEGESPSKSFKYEVVIDKDSDQYGIRIISPKTLEKDKNIDPDTIDIENEKKITSSSGKGKIIGFVDVVVIPERKKDESEKEYNKRKGRTIIELVMTVRGKGKFPNVFFMERQMISKQQKDKVGNISYRKMMDRIKDNIKKKYGSYNIFREKYDMSKFSKEQLQNLFIKEFKRLFDPVKDKKIKDPTSFYKDIFMNIMVPDRYRLTFLYRNPKTSKYEVHLMYIPHWIKGKVDKIIDGKKTDENKYKELITLTKEADKEHKTYIEVIPKDDWESIMGKTAADTFEELRPEIEDYKIDYETRQSVMKDPSRFLGTTKGFGAWSHRAPQTREFTRRKRKDPDALEEFEKIWKPHEYKISTAYRKNPNFKGAMYLPNDEEVEKTWDSIKLKTHGDTKVLEKSYEEDKEQEFAKYFNKYVDTIPFKGFKENVLIQIRELKGRPRREAKQKKASEIHRRKTK